MTANKTLRVVAVAAAVALTVCASASPRPLGESASEFAQRVSISKQRGQFGKVWSYLHPRYQRVTTPTFWEACARKDAKELAAFEIHSLKALEQYPDSIRLPLLGRISVTAVTLEMKYSHPLLGNNRKITDTVYVKKVNGQWKGLWTPEQYAAYAKDRCPA